VTWQTAYVWTLLTLIPLTGCGGGSTSSAPPPPPPPPTITSVSLSTNYTLLQPAQRAFFNVTVQGTGYYNPSVAWSVNGIVGGDAVNGIVSSGVYTAPATLPPTDPVTITATSVADATKSASSTLTIYTIAISPSSANVFYNHTQQFTATVTGISNPVVDWWTVYGKVDASGLYTAPSGVLSTDTVYANVPNAAEPATAAVTLQFPPPVLTSLTPKWASANEGITINGHDLLAVNQVFFAGPYGTALPANWQQLSISQLFADVPLGAVSGPVYVTEITPSGAPSTSNGINFTRLPNIRIRTTAKDLSSGESAQFSYRLLGATSPSAVDWMADLGNMSTSGLYQAPTVSQETFATITGCVQNTHSCDATLLRILPVRITPSAAIVRLGQNIQLEAVEGSTVSANWSLLAGGGTVDSSGLFSAPTNPVQAGGVPVSATSGSVGDVASVGVTGAFPGLVSRTYDYMNFGFDSQTQQYLQQMEGTRARNLAVSGNRAYALDEGIRANPPFDLNPPFTALEVYDISNPATPSWLSAAESVSDRPSLFSTYGRYVFEVDTGSFPITRFTPPSRIALYDVQNNPPKLVALAYAPDLYSAFDNNGVIYAASSSAYTGSTATIYVFDVTSGTIQQSQIAVVPPAGALVDSPAVAAIGTGNLIYAEFAMQSSGVALAAYDVSVSPPNLLGSTLLSSQASGRNMLIRGNQLFAGNTIFDISNSVPSLVATVPVQDVQDVNGTKLLGRGFLPIYTAPDNYVVADISDPANPTLTTSIYDIADDYFTPTARFVPNNSTILTNAGVGGIAATNLSAPGGMFDKARLGVFPDGIVFDHTISQQTLYLAGASALGSGGLITFDLSSGTPAFSGVLLYGQDEAFAVQVSNSTAFLGLLDSLKTVDVSNPANPFETGSLALSTNALALTGNILFDGTTDGRLVILNVSNPNSPSTIGSIVLPAPAVNLRLSGGTLFVADGAAGLLTFDISNPAAAFRLSQFSLPVPVWDVALSGTLAFLAADSSGLVIVDISNLMQPKQLSQTTLDSWSPFPCFQCEGPRSVALSVTVQNGLVYVGTANSAGLVFGFDCSRPSYPRLVSMNAFGEFIDTLISGFSFVGNDIFVVGSLGVDDDVVQSDNSAPRNVINLFYSPLALRSITFFAAQLTSRKSQALVHPKFDKKLFVREHRYLRGQLKHEPRGANDSEGHNPFTIR